MAQLAEKQLAMDIDMLEELCPDSTGDLWKRFQWIATMATMAMLADYLTKKLPSLILRDPLKRGSTSIAKYAYAAVECVASICSIRTSLP